MYCGNNKVALASQKQLSQALMQLLREKPFSEITVCELCRESGISRQTYYTLFNSKENIVIFTLQQQYCYTPRPHEETCSGLEQLCSEYSAYICANREFMSMLVQNDITYLLFDSICEALLECGCFMSGAAEDRRRYAAAFFAGAVTGIVKEYVGTGCALDADILKGVMYGLFSGEFFR